MEQRIKWKRKKLKEKKNSQKERNGEERKGRKKPTHTHTANRKKNEILFFSYLYFSFIYLYFGYLLGFGQSKFVYMSIFFLFQIHPTKTHHRLTDWLFKRKRRTQKTEINNLKERKNNILRANIRNSM